VGAGRQRAHHAAGAEPIRICAESPLRCTDPTGHWIERAVDIAFIADDIWDIRQNGLTWDNGLALAADVGGLLLPGLTGLGMAVRGGKAAKAAAEAASHGDEAADLARSATRISENLAQEAAQRTLPLGFKNADEFAQFGARLKQGLQCRVRRCSGSLPW
jgi:hypothetical protein